MKRWMIVFLVGLSYQPAAGTTIRVPVEQPTIQAGINAAVNGDTVLVEPGTYIEIVNFIGKRIVVGSQFILTGDTSLISSTVIRGESSRYVARFENGEDSTAVLSGFTITGGLRGVYCYNSNPVLRYLIVVNNSDGGGISCSGSSPTLEHTMIMNNVAYWDGGGLSCSYSNPVLTNVQITNNQALYGYGGGIICSHSNPVLNKVVIKGNTCFRFYGGGIHCSNSSPTLTEVLITGNTVTQSVGVGSGGGGISCVSNSDPHLSNVTIARNSARVLGGGIYTDNSATVTFDSITRCNVYLNDAGVGYDISSGRTLRVIVDTFTVRNPRNEHTYPIANFTFNIQHARVSQDQSTLYVAPEGDNGNSGQSWAEPLRTIGFAKSIINATPQSPATIYLAPGIFAYETNGEHFELPWRSYLSLKGSGVNNTILQSDNEAGIFSLSNVYNDTIADLTMRNGGYGLGGAIYCSSSSPILKNVVIRGCSSAQGGAIYASFGSNVTLVNALIFNNSASLYGGGLYGYHARYSLENVTMAYNACGNGSGIYCQSTQVSLVNSILWGNLPDQVYFYQLDSPSSIDVAHSDIQNGQDGIRPNGNGTINWIQGGNSQDDPLFVDSTDQDFHLANASRCIGGGIDSIQINGLWFISPIEDIESSPRPSPANSSPDIGAYENQFGGPTSVADDGDTPNFGLRQNYPNPFNPTTEIRFDLPEAGTVSLIIFDVLGRQAAELASGYYEVGYHSITWNASNQASGVYFAHFNVTDALGNVKYAKVNKLVLMK